MLEKKGQYYKSWQYICIHFQIKWSFKKWLVLKGQTRRDGFCFRAKCIKYFNEKKKANVPKLLIYNRMLIKVP